MLDSSPGSSCSSPFIGLVESNLSVKLEWNWYRIGLELWELFPAIWLALSIRNPTKIMLFKAHYVFDWMRVIGYYFWLMWAVNQCKRGMKRVMDILLQLRLSPSHSISRISYHQPSYHEPNSFLFPSLKRQWAWTVGSWNEWRLPMRLHQKNIAPTIWHKTEKA